MIDEYMDHDEYMDCSECHMGHLQRKEEQMEFRVQSSDLTIAPLTSQEQSAHFPATEALKHVIWDPPFSMNQKDKLSASDSNLMMPLHSAIAKELISLSLKDDKPTNSRDFTDISAAVLEISDDTNSEDFPAIEWCNDKDTSDHLFRDDSGHCPMLDPYFGQEEYTDGYRLVRSMSIPRDLSLLY